MQVLLDSTCNSYRVQIHRPHMDELQAAIDAMIWQILTDTEVYWV